MQKQLHFDTYSSLSSKLWFGPQPAHLQFSLPTITYYESRTEVPPVLLHLLLYWNQQWSWTIYSFLYVPMKQAYGLHAPTVEGASYGGPLVPKAVFCCTHSSCQVGSWRQSFLVVELTFKNSKDGPARSSSHLCFFIFAVCTSSSLWYILLWSSSLKF